MKQGGTCRGGSRLFVKGGVLVCVHEHIAFFFAKKIHKSLAIDNFF